MMKMFRNAVQNEVVSARTIKEQAQTDPTNMTFSAQQRAKLRILGSAHDDEMTAHDVLCAYIILTMNKNIPLIANEHIRRTYILVNYRGVSDVLAPNGYVGNPIMFLLSSDFPNSLSLCSVLLRRFAKRLRQLEMKVTLKNGQRQPVC